MYWICQGQVDPRELLQSYTKQFKGISKARVHKMSSGKLFLPSSYETSKDSNRPSQSTLLPKQSAKENARDPSRTLPVDSLFDRFLGLDSKWVWTAGGAPTKTKSLGEDSSADYHVSVMKWFQIRSLRVDWVNPTTTLAWPLLRHSCAGWAFTPVLMGAILVRRAPSLSGTELLAKTKNDPLKWSWSQFQKPHGKIYKCFPQHFQ